MELQVQKRRAKLVLTNFNNIEKWTSKMEYKVIKIKTSESRTTNSKKVR